MTELEKCNTGLPYSFADPEMIARKSIRAFVAVLLCTEWRKKKCTFAAFLDKAA